MKTPKVAADSVPSSLVENPMSIALGNNLRRIRTERGMTQQNLAFNAEMDRTFLSLCERGLTNPSLFSLGTICWCLEITLAELFAGIKHTFPPSTVSARKRRANQASHESKPPSAATIKRAETMRLKKMAQQEQRAKLAVGEAASSKGSRRPSPS